MNHLAIDVAAAGPQISRHVYGHFAEHLGRCIYDGLWVGEESLIPNTRGWRDDVVAALKKLNIPNLRWPGGCFADTYHWADGVGPKESRPGIVNVFWGGLTETNAVGTHEFLDLCAQLGCEPYLAGNVGSGTVREMAEWIEYITMPAKSPMADLRRANGRDEPWPLRMWGVGNENWGCGGNMRPQFYADLFRQYATYARHYAPGGKLYKVACGLTDEWNEILLRDCAKFMDGLSVHYYTVPGTWDAKGSATAFNVDEWQLTLQKAAGIDGFIRSTSAILDRHDPEKKVDIVMDEWGTWFDVEPGTNPGFLYQQNTIRDALVAGVTLNIFHAHAARVRVANIAQTVNVLQAMILTEGARMTLTPSYHVFEMFKVHHDATQLPVTLTTADYVGPRAMTGVAGAAGTTTLAALPQLSASASRDAGGVTHISLCNLHHAEAAEVTIAVRGATRLTGRVLAAGALNAMNTFDAPDAVAPTSFDGARLTPGGIIATLPARSVVVLAIA